MTDNLSLTHLRGSFFYAGHGERKEKASVDVDFIHELTRLAYMLDDNTPPIPFHLRPQALFPLQHGNYQFAPFLLDVVGVMTGWQLDASKLYPHLPKVLNRLLPNVEEKQTNYVPTDACAYLQHFIEVLDFCLLILLQRDVVFFKLQILRVKCLQKKRVVVFFTLKCQT